MPTRPLPTREVLEDRIRDLLNRLYNIGGMILAALKSLEALDGIDESDEVHAARCTLEELGPIVAAIAEGVDPVNLLAAEATEGNALPDKQVFRREQRGEFMAALEAAMQAGGFALDVQETDGQTVAVIRREQVPA